MSKNVYDLNGKGLNCVILNGKDTYSVWAFTMKEHLKTIGVSSVVEDKKEGEMAESKSELITDERKQQAKSMLLSVISPDEIAKITHCVGASEIWEYFRLAYGAKTSNIKLELMNELSITKFHSAREVVDGLNKVLVTRGKLRQLDVIIDDITILDIILKALSTNFSNFLANWKMLDSDQQTLDRLISKLNEKAREVEESELSTVAMKATTFNQARGNARFIGVKRNFAPKWQPRPDYQHLNSNNSRGTQQQNYALSDRKQCVPQLFFFFAPKEEELSSTKE